MPWITAHLYLTGSIVAVLVLTGVFVVKNQSADTQGPRTLTWGAGGYLFDPSAGIQNTPESASENIYSAIQEGPPFYYDPGVSASSLRDSAPEFDFDAFIAMLSKPSGASQAKEGSDSLPSAYSFIPSGLVSTSTAQRALTPTQQAIRTYGNTAGAIIQSFEPLLRSSPQILKDQFEDRGSSQKNAALTDLAESLAHVGHEMEAMENVPPEMASAHMRVAKSYQEMGEKLANIANTSSEQAAVDAILTYNASVETYIKNYASLATLFSLHEVPFTSAEPGSVFVFTQSSF